MSGVAVDPPRHVESEPDDGRVRRAPRRAVRARALRLEPTTLVPAAAVLVLLAEAAATVRLVLGGVLLVPLLDAARPAAR
jgi:hypothetical protein